MPSRNKIEIVISASDQASKEISKAFGAIQDSGKKIAIGLAAAGAAAGALTASLSGLAKESALSINIQQAFAGVVKSSGKSMDEMLNALERGSAGMVDQTSLMKTYNSAAQLVGTTFANQLPDAMQYLGKVSAATGEDMGYMLDSLVRGVGRLSPMILDNLGIQVDLTKAYEDYAGSIGKSVDELTKQEQQTALMNQVMTKLADNTAAMPDIADSAAAKFARFDARMENLKDTIGRAVIPMFTALVDAIEPVLGMVDALITGDLNARNLNMMGLSEDHPIVAFFFALRRAFVAIGAGVPVVDVLLNMLSDMSGRFQGWGLQPIVDLLSQVWMFLYKIVRPIQEWINQNIRLEDVLIGVGIAIASFIIPALAGIVAGIAAVFAPVALLIGAVALFRKVWEEDIGGVRTFVLEQLLPALDRLRVWFVDEALPAIGKIVDDVWNTVIVPAFQFLADVWKMIAPTLATIADWFITTGLPLIAEAINTVWENVIKPAFEFLRDAWGIIQPGLQSFFNWFIAEGWPVISQALEDAWINIFKPFFEWLGGVWETISPALLSLLEWFQTTGLPFIKQLLEAYWHDTLEPFIQTLGDIWAVVSPALTSLFEWFNTTGWPKIKTAVEDFWNNILKPFIDELKKIWDAVQPYVDAFKTGIGDVFAWIGERAQELIGTIGDILTAIKDLSDSINNSPIGDVAPAGMGALGGLGTILNGLGFQNGGIITQPTMGVIGENLGAGQFEAVLNSEQIQRLLAEARQGGGSSVQINFNGSGGPTTEADAMAMGNTIGSVLAAQGAIPH